jgi:membrane associated rhomboid family serine protease
MRPPLLAIVILAANVLVYLYMLFLPEPARELFTRSFGLVPWELTSGRDLVGHDGRGLYHAAARIPFWLTPLSSMFLHGGFAHLAGNMWFLWVFGDNVEDRLGHARFFLFYLLAGLAAAASQVLVFPRSTIPMVGASGAIAGVLGAYVVLFPRARVRSLLFLFVFVQMIDVPAFILLGIWFLAQMLSASSSAPGVAWFAHLGGFVFGLLAVKPFMIGRPQRLARMRDDRGPGQRRA